MKVLWVVVIGFFLFASPSLAVTLEHEVNILDQTFSNASNSASPDDNSLGMIHWDDDYYPNATVIFEAVISCDSCSGGNARALANLYTANSMQLVTNSSVTTLSNSYQLVQSAEITGNLTDDTDYTVRLSRDATAGTAYIKAARLVIVNTNALLTQKETQVEIGAASTTSNSSYDIVGSPKLIQHNSDAFMPLPSAYFEASLKTSESGGTAYAGLTTSGTCASIVSGSEVTSTSPDWKLVRSNAITLDSGVTYFVCVKSSSGQTTSIANAKLIYQQSDGYSITRTQSYLSMVNAYTGQTAADYTNTDFPMMLNKGNFTGSNAVFSYFFDTTLRSSADTGYVRLYNTNDSAIITDSELSTGSGSYSHFRTGNIGSNLPALEKEIDTQLRNANGGTTGITTSQLVVNMSIPPELSFSIEPVATSTQTNGMTTSATSEVSMLDFGYLTPGIPKYIAHKLNASTTAGYGYTVSLKMNSTMQGNYPANIIEEFPATWTSPIAWTHPTGTVANVNTGWIGANTSDTRVEGWNNAANLFGPLGTVSRTVMKSEGTDSGTSIYVTYVIEVNEHQPMDLYAGTIEYNILPTY